MRSKTMPGSSQEITGDDPELILRSPEVYDSYRAISASGRPVMSFAQWWATLAQRGPDLSTEAMNEVVAYANDLTKDGDAQFVCQN